LRDDDVSRLDGPCNGCRSKVRDDKNRRNGNCARGKRDDEGAFDEDGSVVLPHRVVRVCLDDVRQRCDAEDSERVTFGQGDATSDEDGFTCLLFAEDDVFGAFFAENGFTCRFGGRKRSFFRCLLCRSESNFL
jgi:hypothetical protein